MLNYLTKEGFENLKRQLQELKTTKRKEIAQRLEHAKSLGDLSENAEYQEAKEEQSLVESQIAELEETLRNAVIIEGKKDKSKVQIGSTITVQSKHGTEVYTIVGSEEADPLIGKISNESPMGSAFLDRRKGEVVKVRTPGGVTEYKIIGIE